MKLSKSSNNIDYQRFKLCLEDGTIIYKFVEECEGCPQANLSTYCTDEYGNKIDCPRCQVTAKIKAFRNDLNAVNVGDVGQGAYNVGESVDIYYNDSVAASLTISQVELTTVGTFLYFVEPFNNLWISGYVASEGVECGCKDNTERWCRYFWELGLDNSYTNYRDTGATITFETNIGNVFVGTVPDGTGSWTNQVDAFAVVIADLFPHAKNVRAYCQQPNTGAPPQSCGGLPAPNVYLPKMKWRYAGFRICPEEEYPIKATYNSDQRSNVLLDLDYQITSVEYFDRCFDCGEKGQWTSLTTGLTFDDIPTCAVPNCADYPEVPAEDCYNETIYGCVFDDDDTVAVNNVVLLYKNCQGAEQFSYVIDFGLDTQDEVNLAAGQYFAYCDGTLPEFPVMPFGQLISTECLEDPDTGEKYTVETWGVEGDTERTCYVYDANKQLTNTNLTKLIPCNTKECEGECTTTITIPDTSTWSITVGGAAITATTITGLASYLQGEGYTATISGDVLTTNTCEEIVATENVVNAGEWCITHPLRTFATFPIVEVVYSGYNYNGTLTTSPAALFTTNAEILADFQNLITTQGWDMTVTDNGDDTITVCGPDVEFVSTVNVWRSIIQVTPVQIVGQVQTSTTVTAPSVFSEIVSLDDCTIEKLKEGCTTLCDTYLSDCGFTCSALVGTGRAGIQLGNNFAYGGIVGTTWENFTAALEAAGYTWEIADTYNDDGLVLADGGTLQISGPVAISELTYTGALGDVTLALNCVEKKALLTEAKVQVEFPTTTCIESREVCLDVGGTVVNAYAVLELTTGGTTLLRYENAIGETITGTWVNCDCNAVDIITSTAATASDLVTTQAGSQTLVNAPSTSRATCGGFGMVGSASYLNDGTYNTDCWFSVSVNSIAPSESYTIDWGDGTVVTGATSIESHSYSAAGTYNVVLTFASSGTCNGEVLINDAIVIV